jgi:hypothetical protein
VKKRFPRAPAAFKTGGGVQTGTVPSDKPFVEYSSRRGANHWHVSAALPFILTALCAGILAAGLLYARSQRRSMHAAVSSELSSIAGLKVQQILAWRRERIADSALLASEPLAMAAAGDQSRLGLGKWLEAFRRLYGYRDVAVVDSDGSVRDAASEDLRRGASDSGLLPLVQAALQSGQPIASDLKTNASGAKYLDFAAPVLLNGAPTRRAVFLRVEASAFLYGLVESWPTPSPSAECLLVRLEGNRVRYLNQPRHNKKDASEMTLPLRGDLPEAMAVTGQEGVHEGRDYRGVWVVAALRRIPRHPLGAGGESGRRRNLLAAEPALRCDRAGGGAAVGRLLHHTGSFLESAKEPVLPA